jgi:hypothetical protein
MHSLPQDYPYHDLIIIKKQIKTIDQINKIIFLHFLSRTPS